MTDHPTLGEMFAQSRDRLKAVAWRMAVDGHRERGGPPPRRQDTDTLIDGIAERLLRRHWQRLPPPVTEDDRQYRDDTLGNLETALILDFMSQTGDDEDDAQPRHATRGFV
jgi:hypothetical protein